MSPQPYWSDGRASLYLGDMREILPALEVRADLVLADPPYAETSLAWDRWPDGWVEVAASVSQSMWCFGSLRMFGERWGEFAAAKWKLSHEAEAEWIDHAVWEKQNGSGFATDRFKKVHELIGHWYAGSWADAYKDVPRELEFSGRRDVIKGRGPGRVPHTGEIGDKGYGYDGTRFARSVIRCRNMQQRAIHPTEKPVGILDPLISYACPPGGLVVAPFAGSGSDLDAARSSGRRAIGIERHEPYAEAAAKRLDQMTLDFGEPA